MSLSIYLRIYQPVDRARKGKTNEGRKRKESGADAYPAAELEEDAEGREDDGEDDVDAVGRARHGRRSFVRRTESFTRSVDGEKTLELSRAGWDGKGW